MDEPNRAVVLTILDKSIIVCRWKYLSRVNIHVAKYIFNYNVSVSVTKYSETVSRFRLSISVCMYVYVYMCLYVHTYGMNSFFRKRK